MNVINLGLITMEAKLYWVSFCGMEVVCVSSEMGYSQLEDREEE